MPTTNEITDHEWQDIACMGLGVLTLLSPWLVQDQPAALVTVNAVVVGLAVLLISEVEMAGHSVREELGNGAAGLWLVASPWIFGYGGELMGWHCVLGAIVIAFSAVELWQERRSLHR